jgi:hypothetical protein
MGAKYNHSVIYFLVLIVAFSIVGTGQEQPSTPYSYENQLDINNASYEEIALLMSVSSTRVLFPVFSNCVTLKESPRKFC